MEFSAEFDCFDIFTHNLMLEIAAWTAIEDELRIFVENIQVERGKGVRFETCFFFKAVIAFFQLKIDKNRLDHTDGSFIKLVLSTQRFERSTI